MASATIFVLMCALAVPYHSLTAQFDSTAMPSLELLAIEAGRASRAHPLRVVAPRLLCEPGHPLVDSASLAACATLPADRAAAITSAFARGIQLPLGGPAEGDSADALPICPADLDRTAGPRVYGAIGRLTMFVPSGTPPLYG